MKLSHIGLWVNDLYETTLFYKKVFGFKEIYNYISVNTPGLKTVFLTNGHITIELLHKSGDPHILYSRNHVSFEVDNVDFEFERLLQLNVVILRPPRNTGDGFREIEIRDPEGHIIELTQRIAPIITYPVKAVIFDLDGTIIDSEDNYYEADRLLLSHYGVEFTQEMKKKYIGTGNHAMMIDIKNRFQLEESLDNLLKQKNEIYLKIAREHTNIYPKMKEFIEILHQREIPMALASGSSPEIIRELTEILGLKQYFKAILSAEDIGKSKPAPDIFYAAAERLEAAPENCVVIEDSKYGVEAAKRAFMKCIAVPYLAEKPLDDAFITADLLFENGMSDFAPSEAIHWIDTFKG